MKHLFTLALLVIANFVAAQAGPNNPDYKKAVEIGLGELQKGQCQPCIEAYERAFVISKHSALSHLRAARCAQMCNDMAKAEALANKAVEISWDMAAQVLQNYTDDPELTPLRDSDLGKKTLEKAESAARASGFNAELAKELDLLKEEDQKYRRLNDEYHSKYTQDSPEYQSFMHDWLLSDSLCLAKAEAIILQYGYPGKSLVGESRQDAIWLVIQHAPLEKQEKYFPLIDAAAQKGEMRKSSWILLVDRIRMHKGKPQIYGSQVVRDETTGGWKFHEIENEADVNKHRAEVGLGPLEEYAQRMGVTWKPK
ncbi:MAG: hypothetical protein H7246_13780 [Phycisphaerae bacterium]|nr:hypothetical protein [Saprospiraceae bacterium]